MKQVTPRRLIVTCDLIPDQTDPIAQTRPMAHTDPIPQPEPTAQSSLIAITEPDAQDEIANAEEGELKRQYLFT